MPCSAASYVLKVDRRRGPNLYAGISVEKAFEDDEKARESAAKARVRFEWQRLDERWDWYRFVSSLPQIETLVRSVAEELGGELYLWVEFGEEGEVASQYYMVTGNALYWRGGFKPIRWSEVAQFVEQPHPRSWGGVYLVRAFALDECSPYLSEWKVVDVFKAMRPIRDTWRGLIP